MTWDLTPVALLLAVALLFKVIFVDYLADVALYTSSDENSAFYQTRTAILKEAARKLRALLRDSRYASVAVAGHSLGSVIGYDAINWLRSEARLGSPLQRPAVTALADLRELAGRLPPSDASAAEALLVEIEGGLGETEDPASRPVTSAEFARLTTFITFGSPLNKVLYFFRTKVKVYETVRGHIVQELHGFRLPPSLLIRDPSLQDDTVPVADGLCWVNVYSPMDPVSAKLMPPHRGVHDHRRWFKTWGRCHISYWHDPKFYREVLAALQGRCAWGHARSRGRSATPVGGSGPRPADPAT